MSKASPFKSKIPYLKRANDFFTSKHKVAYPWLATKRDPKLLEEWCEVLARYRALEGRDDRPKEPPDRSGTQPHT